MLEHLYRSYAGYAAQEIWRTISDTGIETRYFLVFISVLVMVRLVAWLRYLRTLPPGPWGFPMFGYLPFFRRASPHLHLTQLAKKHGPISSVQLGNQLIVILNDHELIRDAFASDSFIGRPHTEFMSILDGYGIINSEGDIWKEQRQFLFRQLRHFGMTKSGKTRVNLETKINIEVDALLKGLKERKGAPTNISLYISMSISNVICSLMMNKQVSHDVQFKRFMGLIEEGFQLFGKVMDVNYLPIMRYLPSVRTVLHKIEENRVEMAKFFEEIINEHKEKFPEENNARDIVDAYLLEIKRAKNDNEVLFQGKNHERQIQQILGDLFSAGVETIKTTLEWAVVFMLHYPEAAKAVQDEVDKVTKRKKLPTMKDVSDLPITQATILEVMRRSSVVPLGTIHSPTRDVTFHGYTIPARSQVTPMLCALNMEPKLWDDPEAFRPSRFLSSEGKLCKPKHFMPFGTGRRACLGEMMAELELSMFFSSLMYTFDLKLPEGASLPSLEGNIGSTLSPDPFNVCLVQRECDQECGSEIASNNPLRNIGSH